MNCTTSSINLGRLFNCVSRFSLDATVINLISTFLWLDCNHGLDNCGHSIIGCTTIHENVGLRRKWNERQRNLLNERNDWKGLPTWFKERHVSFCCNQKTSSFTAQNSGLTSSRAVVLTPHWRLSPAFYRVVGLIWAPSPIFSTNDE